MNILKKYYPLIVAICAFIFSSSSCLYMDDENNDFTVDYSIKNNDSDTIYVVYRDLPITTSDQTTGISPSYVFNKHISLIEILPGKSLNKLCAGDLYYNTFRNSMDTIMRINHIIVFRKGTIDKYTKEEMAEKNIYDAIYKLSTREILDMGCVIPFPMKHEEN